jgi:hypothetical protein
MIERLGRMFPVWKHLHSQFEEMAVAKTRADDEIRRLRSQLETLQSQLNAANADGRKSMEQVANWAAQAAFGRPIYGPLSLPEDAPPAEMPPPPRRIHGRELVQRAEREIREALADDTRI